MTKPASTVAILSISKVSQPNAFEVFRQQPSSTIYIPERHRHERDVPDANVVYFHEPLKELISSLFPRYSFLVFFLPLGAVVRLIAPLLRDKETDPGVLVIDDAGRFIISLVGGHVGGANEKARNIAHAIGGTAVITTSSDVLGLPAVDLLGVESGWSIEHDAGLQHTASALINNDPLAYIQETGEKNDWWSQAQSSGRKIFCFERLEDFLAKASDDPNLFSAAILVSDRSDVRTFVDGWNPKCVVFRPRSLCIGIGCDTGVTVKDISNLQDATMEEHLLSGRAVRCIATIDIKAKEPGVISYMNERGYELKAYNRDSLIARRERVISPSSSEKILGVPSVSESSSLAAGDEASPNNHSVLVVPKIKGNRCTMAISRISF